MASMTDKPLIDLLETKEIITPAQATEARAYTQELGVTPEEALTACGILSQDDIAALYGDLYQLRFLKLEDVEIDLDAVRHVPAHVAHRHHVIPIRRSGSALAVAMADPSDSEARAALKQVTDFEIIPFLGWPEAIEHAIYVNYGERPESEGDSETSAKQEAPRSINHVIGAEDRVGHMTRSVPVSRSFTMDSLVVSTANEHAASLAKQLLKESGEEGIVVYLFWGATGTGKSHLLHAIANHWTSQHPLKRFLLTTGNRFCNHLYESIRDRKHNLFKYVYRELDLLMIDDAHAFLTREWAQQELVDTCTALARNRKRLVLAASEDLATSGRTIPSLRQLLEQGKAVQLNAYSPSARLEILTRNAGGIELPEDILNYLSGHAGENVHDMLSVLQQLVVMAAKGERRVDAQTVAELIHAASARSESGFQALTPAVSGAHKS